ncbi:YhcH/YjgK/YiaL family protein [Ancylomarina sp. YFZ004]
MIIDKIENLNIYANLSERLAKGIDYINNSDFSKIDLGTYQIEGDDVFAMVQEYDTRAIDNCKLEGHIKYIDIQYIIEGEEHIGLTSKTNQELEERNDEGDYAFYKGDSTLFKFNPSVFGIFFPDDLHMPCVGLNQISKVRKVVVKVRI